MYVYICPTISFLGISLSVYEIVTMRVLFLVFLSLRTYIHMHVNSTLQMRQQFDYDCGIIMASPRINLTENSHYVMRTKLTSGKYSSTNQHSIS